MILGERCHESLCLNKTTLHVIPLRFQLHISTTLCQCWRTRLAAHAWLSSATHSGAPAQALSIAGHYSAGAMTALFTCGCSGYQVNSDLPVVPGRYIQRHRTLTESWLGFAAVNSFQHEFPAAHLSTERLSWVILFCRALLTRRIQYASAVLVCCLRNAVESSVRLVKVSKSFIVSL